MEERSRHLLGGEIQARGGSSIFFGRLTKSAIVIPSKGGQRNLQAARKGSQVFTVIACT